MGNFSENVFKDKVVLLPCDDPEWSSFTKFFILNFRNFGLKKLISTSYAHSSKKVAYAYSPSQFESENDKFDSVKSTTNGKLFVLDREHIHEGQVNLEDIEWSYLEGDGDFRSEEVTVLRDEADIIVTNPPFSLFREFITWIIDADKKFLLIGNINAITYKEVFPLIMENRVWLGATNFNTGMYFRVPEDFVYADSYNFERELDGVKVNRVPGVCWFSNLEHGRRHEAMPLLTIRQNLKYTRHEELIGKKNYDHYDNCDAIEVPYADMIPSDYEGVMGVPISFLDRYCPEQFHIKGITKTWFGFSNKEYPEQIQVSKNGKKSKVTKLNDGATIEVVEAPDDTYYIVDNKMYIQRYARVLIQKVNYGNKT